MSSAVTRTWSTPLAGHRHEVDEPRVGEGVHGLEPGQVDDLLDQLGEPGRLDLHPPREAGDRLRVVVGVEHGLGEQREPTDGRLQLVRDVGDEVAPDLLDAPRLRPVLDEQQDVRGPEGGHAGVDEERRVAERPARQLELGLAMRWSRRTARPSRSSGCASSPPRTSPVDSALGENVSTASEPSRTMPLLRSTASTSPTPSGNVVDVPSMRSDSLRLRSRAASTTSRVTAMPTRTPPIAATAGVTSLSVRV